MSSNILHSLPHVIFTYNVTRTIGESISTTAANSLSFLEQATTATNNGSLKPTEISPLACIAFVILILATVGGNTLVLLALYLDKGLHSPSFYLIANMATADLLLGLFVLPFSSVLELLNERWIFGESFCSAWLALDVLCCTASIMALMGISIDRYIGVTRPLNYSGIMTTRRTIYLVIVVWAVSILTSVVPLFGLTDREKKSNESSIEQERFKTCKVNKNTFYTIFSSMISFYIPVIILLILYSRVYQEAKKQGEKLENEKRRLFQIDYQIASEHLRRKRANTNELTADSRQNDQHSPRSKRSYSSIPDVNRIEAATKLLSNGKTPDEDGSLDHSLTLTDGTQLKKDYTELKNNIHDDDTIHSGSSLAHHINSARRSLGKRISTTMKRTSQPLVPHFHHHNGHMSPNDELLIIRRKLHNLKREKKAFRTLGLILSALLICWLPFFVTLPVMSILKHHGMIKDGNTESTWFKIAFWLGYCNSALNPFVYAFSNRAIRRAFRQVLFRRFCCCRSQCWLCRYFCPNKATRYSEPSSSQYQRTHSNSFTTQTSQVAPRRASSSFSADIARTIPKQMNNFDVLSNSPIRTPGGSGGPVVSFAEFLPVTNSDDEIISNNNNKQSSNQELNLTSIQNTSP
ncbi:unnamed protein product [Adineta steineri]|uniref:G-protein coupled receptors family 1 profile domain-containing protein n=1 Tax=Adineta steineri TaxID=433720 RepID=A0A815QP14_9BILA|nr:unnamed protein product [Adineta steineri]CAF3777515.1 unnamed protein product [Adineta steineri]